MADQTHEDKVRKALEDVPDDAVIVLKDGTEIKGNAELADDGTVTLADDRTVSLSEVQSVFTYHAIDGDFE